MPAADASRALNDVLSRLRQLRLVIAAADCRDFDDIDTLISVAESESRRLAATWSVDAVAPGSPCTCMDMPPLIGPRSTREAWKTYAFWVISKSAEVNANHVDQIAQLRAEVARCREAPGSNTGRRRGFTQAG